MDDGGNFTWIERMLLRKLMWLLCFLHLNELPLCHTIYFLISNHYDAQILKVAGLVFLDPLGKIWPTLSIFPAIKVGLPLLELKQDIVDDLSIDQLYGYTMVSVGLG